MNFWAGYTVCLKNIRVNVMNNVPKKLVTHNGSFHADDIFACATLELILEKQGEAYEVIRTRDEQIIKSGDYVFDVGGIYDPEQNRFDHHQKGGAGRRTPSAGEGQESVAIEYASFGLVWQKFGKKLCSSQRVVDILDKKLAAPIDAFDNGMELVQNKFDVSPYYLQHIFFAMRPTWQEEESRASVNGARYDFAKSKDMIFLKCVEMAKEILSREIIQTEHILLAETAITDIYKSSADKRIIVLDKKYPYDYILNNFPEPIFAVYPRKITGDWAAEAVRDNPKTFVSRKDFPKAWAGLRDEELQKVTGISDAIFCHRGLYLAVAKSKEGAIELAKKALAS
jgi:uncharacterized UPF0160 family protein